MKNIKFKNGIDPFITVKYGGLITAELLSAPQKRLCPMELVNDSVSAHFVNITC